MSRVLVLIDGFNYYHRLDEYQDKYNECVKWLNYRSLIESYLDDKDKENVKIIYFSAIAKHRPSHSQKRHKTYINALKSQNIDVVLGNFKDKFIIRCKNNEKCSNCLNTQDKTKLKRHEEKNTDVNIAITLIEYTIMNQYDKCFILSSDSDFSSAVLRAKQLAPDKQIIICPPPYPDKKIRNCLSGANNLTKISGQDPLFIYWNKIKANQFPDDFNGLINPWQVTKSVQI